jgi:hypothetical protein
MSEIFMILIGNHKYVLYGMELNQDVELNVEGGLHISKMNIWDHNRN